MLLKQLFQIFLLIFQNHKKCICTELHRFGKLFHNGIIQITGFLNDQRTTRNLGNRRRDILFIEILCINLCNLYRFLAFFFTDRLCKTNTERRLSTALCTKNDQIADSGRLICRFHLLHYHM